MEDAGRTALVEMRRLLGVIRADEPVGTPGDRAPQPRLEDLPGLVQRVREAGLPVSYVIDGDPVRVPAGVAVCAYRIVQEALSNVVRHCGAVPATGASAGLGLLAGPGRGERAAATAVAAGSGR